MTRKYLRGVSGDAINLFMAAAAFNFRKWMRKLCHFFLLLRSGCFSMPKVISRTCCPLLGDKGFSGSTNYSIVVRHAIRAGITKQSKFCLTMNME